MTDHTPGPWKVYHQELRKQFPGHKIIEVQTREGQAVIPWGGFDSCDMTKKQKLANARLIAKAPDMLILLRCIEDEASDGTGELTRATLSDLRDLLEKFE
jgi:hypothetical protein